VSIHLSSRAPRDERGSLIVVISIILVLVLICAAVAAEVIGNQKNVLSKSNSAASVSAADAGLADALFRLDQMSPATATSFCVDNGKTWKTKDTPPQTVTCDSAPASLSGARYTAWGQYTGTMWTIQSEATVKGIAGAVQETITYSAKYPYAIFGNSGLDFNGQNPGGVGAYNEGTSKTGGTPNPDGAAGDCTNGVGPSCVKVGSNGPIKCAGGLTGNVSEVYYTGGGGAGLCLNPIPDPARYVLTIPTAPGIPANCPGVAMPAVNGVVTYEIGSNVPGWGTLPAGTWYCNDNPLEINGNLIVSGQATIYIILDNATNNTMINSGIQTLYITGGSEVNASFDGTAGPPTNNTTPLPQAENLQILSNSSGTVGSALGGGTNGPYTFGGIIYAPNANLVGNGCKSAYYGAITLNLLTCNGGPHLQVYYDNALATMYGPPEISGYAQVNQKSVGIP
jgi:Tfp pilus assembly protein PilX